MAEPYDMISRDPWSSSAFGLCTVSDKSPRLAHRSQTGSLVSPFQVQGEGIADSQCLLRRSISHEVGARDVSSKYRGLAQIRSRQSKWPDR
jgi:hypothetical protein